MGRQRAGEGLGTEGGDEGSRGDGQGESLKAVFSSTREVVCLAGLTD